MATLYPTLYPAIISDKPPLRVGVMLDGRMAPAWVAEVLHSIQQSAIARVTTLIRHREMPPAPPAPPDTVLDKADSGSFLWASYVKLDEKRHPDLLAAFRPTHLGDVLADAGSCPVTPLDDGAARRFSDADLAAVRARNLDVILHFGTHRLRGDILSAARYGVWSYHHGDHRHYRSGPAGFWEMLEGNPLTGVTLRILGEEADDDQVIYRSVGATGSFESLLKNRVLQYRKAIPFAMRCLRKVYVQGVDGLVVEPLASPLPAHNARPHGAPGNRQMLGFLGRTLFRTLWSKVENRRGVVQDHWFLAYATGRETHPQSNQGIVAIHPPEGHFWADPSVVKSKGKHYVFFEDFDYARGLGHLAVFEITADGTMGPARPVLNTGKHLSYPFVFEWQGEHYMIPESSSERTVNLYRALNFPDQWVLENVLLQDIAAVDATLFEQDGVWYLFANVSESGGSKWDELFLFVAASPRGPWAPHPLNPIVSDVRTARPAGALFRKNGVLYRPAQDCAKSYGASIAVQEVLELSPSAYCERTAYRIEPTWLPDIQGCHTISLSDEISLYDCKMRKRQPINNAPLGAAPIGVLQNARPESK